MRLRIAGVNHNDVLGRERLIKWLQEVKAVEGTHPAFVAVEYDEEIFYKIREQRPILGKLVASVWTNTPSPVRKVIEESLVYEGDIHNMIFPGVETVWLDQGRNVSDSTIISNYARDKLNVYRCFIPVDQAELGDESLRHMSISAWKRVVSPQPGGPRDIKFAQLIADRSRWKNSGWAIVIVGIDHACEVEGRMVTLLKDQGINCQVNELKP